LTNSAFHSDATIKAAVLEAVGQIHHQNTVLAPKSKACLTDCPLHAGSGKEIESRLGIPVAVLSINECFFLMQEYDAMPFWNDRFIRSIAAGADLSKIAVRFVDFLFNDKKLGIIRLLSNKTLYRQVLETISVSSPDKEKLGELKIQLEELDKSFQDPGKMTSEYEPAIHLVEFTMQPDAKTADRLITACGARFQYGKGGKTWRYLSRTYSEKFLELLIATSS